MNARRIIALTLLAVAGVFVAVGITTAATELTSQRVGLQEEPLDAGDDLAPAVATNAETTTTPTTRTTRTERERRRTTTTRETAPPRATTTQEQPPPAATTEQELEDDNSGHGRGRDSDRGRSGDDD